MQDSVFAKVFGCFSSIEKLLSRADTQTHERKHLQSIRAVRDISRDNRARIATCSLQTATDRFKEKYSIDYRTIKRAHKAIIF